MGFMGMELGSAHVLQGQGGGLHGKGSGVLEFGWSEGWAEGSGFQLVY